MTSIPAMAAIPALEQQVAAQENLISLLLGANPGPIPRGLAIDTVGGARAAGPFPVIVEFTPYLRLGQPIGVIPYFVERGYIYAVVRPRGTGGSTGQMQQFTSQDGRDGAAVVDWAANLEGADGRVAMAGCSYPAATGLATAAAVRPGSPLKALVSACIGLDMQHRQVWTSNGLPNAALSAYAPRAGAMMGKQPSVTGYFANFLKGVMAGGARPAGVPSGAPSRTRGGWASASRPRWSSSSSKPTARRGAASRRASPA